MNFSNLPAHKIVAIEIFGLEVQKERHFSFGSWKSRVHAVLCFQVGTQRGWSEMICAHNAENFDIEAWSQRFALFQGLSVNDALQMVRTLRDSWSARELETVEIALLDLAGQLLECPALELLKLRKRDNIPGMATLLEDSTNSLRMAAREAQSMGLRTHCKIKIFGDVEGDCELIAAQREEFGPQAFLTADANCGYAHQSGESLVPLAEAIRHLRCAGLDAIEDPARLSNSEWVQLQSLCGGLSLLPDVPLRPVWKAHRELLPHMGRIYNFHPGCLGSLTEAVVLAQRVQNEFGAQVVIGDDSLVGPGCSIWQQVAIGLGASWVEALEKPEENDQFLRAIRAQNTAQHADGTFGLNDLRPGWGMDVNVEALRETANTNWSSREHLIPRC